MNIFEKDNWLLAKNEAQITFFTLVVIIILFIIISAFSPMISQFTGYVTADPNSTPATATVWGLIPTFIGLAFIGTMFVFFGRRQQ